MKKLFLFTWMMMLSIVAMAQSIIVVDKNGNRTVYAPDEVSSIEFLSNPPSFIVNKYADARQFVFDKVQSVKGLPDYVLVYPDTVYVSADGGDFTFDVKASVEFDATPSDGWISFVSQNGDKQKYTAYGNDDKIRMGYIAIVSKDQLLKDTVWVVQAGKAESDFNYIYFYNLKCVTPDQEICVGFISNGSNSNFPGDVSTAARGYKSRFQITHYEDGKWQPVKEQMINFEPEKGSCDPTTVYTNASGEVETTFFPNNIWIGEGNVKASSSLTFDSGESWTGYANANYSFIDIYNLDNISSQKEVIRGETGIANFKLTKFVNGGWVPCVGQEIEVNFENCSFGGANTLKASTDAAGEVTFTFSPDNNISVTECSITATCPVKLKNGRTATGVSKATFKISEKYKIECDDKGSIYCSKDGNRVLRFLLLEHSPEHGWIASQKAPACTFGATNGTVDQNGKFNDFGIVLATFTPTGSFSPTDPGSLTVRTSITYPDGGVWNGECSVTILYEDGYRLECLTPEKIVEPAKTEACEFRLLKKENDNWVPAEGKEISIFVDKALSHHKTDAEGKVSVDFYQNALADEVEISASFAFMDGTGYHTGQTSTKFYLARYRMLPNMLEAHIDGKQPFDFISFHLDEWVDPGLWFPCEGKKITFEATGGTVTPNSDVTAKDGYVYVNFKPEKNFQGGTVTGKCEIALPSGKIWQSEWTVKLIQEDLIQLKCLSPEQYIAPGEEKTCEFQLMHRESPNAAWEVYPNQEIVATPVNGKLNPHIWPTTDAEGKVSLNYKMDADKFEGSVEAKYQEIINGIIYCIQTKADYFSAPYRLMANVEKMYVDGHDTYNLVFYLQEYVDGQWQTCETEHEIMVEATGGTFKKVDQLGLAKPGYISINFTPEDNFKEGSVTVKSEITLEDGRVWKGEATTVLLLEEDCKLECLTEDLDMVSGEEKQIDFLLTQKVDDEWVPCADKTIEFSATNGSVTPYNSNKTQADGKTFTKFTLDKGKTQGTVHAKYIYLDKNDIYHHVRTDVDLSLLLYKLMANEEKMYIDGYDTYNLVFYLQEYVDGQWQTCETEHEIKVEATGGTFKKVDQLGLAKPGYISINFTPEDNFKEGSVTVKSEIMLEDGRVWKGEVTTVLLLEEDCKLECLTEDLTVAYGEDKRIEFLLTQKVDDEWVPCADKTIEFSATNGSVTPYNSNKTQADGKTFTKFTLDKDKTQGTVHAKYLYRDQDHIYHYVRTDVDLSLQKYNLECLTPDVEIKKGESADIRFRLLEFNSDKNEWVPCHNKKITFTAENGSCTPDWMETNDEGIAQANFTPAADATQGTLTGSCTIVLDEKTHLSWSQSKTAHITITDGGGGGEPCVVDDPDLQKANQLDNGYVVKNTKTGETQIRSYNPDYSEWKKTTDFIDFQLNDEYVDAEGTPNTKGMLYGHIPVTMRGVVLMLTGQQFENTPGAKVGFGLYDGLYVSTDFMCTSGEGGSMTTEGEIKPNGKSKILIRKPCNQTTANAPRRAPGDEDDDYTGEYELLYYLVFTTRAYNPETQQSEEVELEVYGKGTMVMHVPSVTSFVARTEKDWVKVGESTKVTLEQYYEEGATWDWNDVEIVGQSPDYSKARNGEDEGYFSWDAATQTLTSLKSNDNKDVWVYLGLKSKPSVKAPVQVATGDGWKYTMIKTSKAEISCKANSYPDFSFDWSPKASDSEKMDFNALELDPESDPNGYFSFPTSYASQGWPVWVSSSCPPGEYTLKFRVKSNHNVNCTMKFIVSPEE